ncbi:MAG: hypothetical protein WCL39_05505, partial [Armatimonadota bacterium]
PFDPNPPDGLLRPDIVHIPELWEDQNNDNILELVTPEAVIISWTTIPGKQYTLLYSPDLVDWLPVPGETFISDGSPADYNFTLAEDSKLFWRVRIEDVDSDGDGLTDAEEAVLGTDSHNAQTIPGISDFWLATYFTNILLAEGPNAIDPNSDPNNDGYTIAQEAFLNLNPNVSNTPITGPIGQETIVNGDFSLPAIGTGNRYDVSNPTWDYWGVGGMLGWSAVVGDNIEYQNIESTTTGDQYCELKAHPGDPAHYGIKQQVGTREGVTYLLVFDCKAWQNTTLSKNDFLVDIKEVSSQTITFANSTEWITRAISFTAANVITEISFVPTTTASPNDTMGCLVDNVKLVPFDIESASIRNGQFVVNVPDVNQDAIGTLDLIIRRQGSTSNEVILKTLTNQAAGRVTITLDDIMNRDPSPLDGEDTRRFDRVKARWRTGSIDVTSGDRNLDVHAVEVLARRLVSNYFSPTWGGTWGGNSLQKGVYPAGQFPAGLYNAARQTEFLNALDPQNEGLAMDENTVIRDQVRPAHNGFNRVIYLNGNDQGYIENPDRDQRNTATASTVSLIRATSVAVRTNADRLSYQTADEVYIPEFSVRTVDDSGTLHGNTDQIDVWRGQGDQTLQNTVDNFGIRRRTCLKIIPAPEP